MQNTSPSLPNKTIAAIASPPGDGGIAVIRISGKESIPIANQLFSKDITKQKSHTASFGQILEDNTPIDEVLLLVFRAPKSYTGEDTVEINCHGGSLISKKILELLLQKGAHPAGPGEFTYQAFQNGKIDLAQAEAVQQFIGAKNTLAMNAASKQLGGALSTHVSSLQKELLDTAAILEAWVDFPEEGLEFASKDEILDTLGATLKKLKTLESTFDEGQKIHEGLTLCLVGTPNAGKSSLMNLLLGTDRAIVTHLPGTTRDTLEAELTFCNLHFQLIDTAGIRTTDELIEKEGIRRTKNAMDSADLILLVIDVSKPLTEEEHTLLATSPREKTLIIWNKTDLPHEIPPHDSPYQVPLSAKTAAGTDHLKDTLQKVIWQGQLPEKDQILLTNIRHKEAITSASQNLTTLIEGLQTNISPEFLSSDMRSCLQHLSSILGMDISEEILSSIFAKFCVGK